MSSRGPRRWLRWVIAAVVVVIVIGVGGPYVFFHFIEGNGPAPLSLTPSPSTSTSAPGTQSASPVSSQGSPGPVAGTWVVGSGSRVGYRVKEILAGQSHTAVGRTSPVTGQMLIKGTAV